jgi:hypothetical protein
VLRLHEQAIATNITQGLAIVVLCAPVNFALSTATWVALAMPPSVKFPLIAARTSQRLYPSIVVSAFFAIVVSLLAAFTWAMHAALSHKAHTWFGYRGGDIFGIALGAVGALLIVAAVVLCEIARAWVALGHNAPTAIVRAFGTLARRPARLGVALWSRIAAAAFVALAAAFLAQRANLRSTASFAVVVVAHQATALLFRILRASWQHRVLQVLADD